MACGINISGYVHGEGTNEKLLVNKQMIKTGINEIPNLYGLESVINKKAKFGTDKYDVTEAAGNGKFTYGIIIENEGVLYEDNNT